MATFFSVSSTKSRMLPAILAAAACCTGSSLCHSKAAVAGPINASDFKIDVGLNMTWVDNASNPYVGLYVQRLTAYERAVLNSKPYVRVSNFSQGGQLQAFELDLTARPGTAVTGVDFSADQRGSAWSWREDAKALVINFANPVVSGTSVTFRIFTGADRAQPSLYDMQQNYFCKNEAGLINGGIPVSAPGWGVIGLTVTDPTLGGGGSLRAASTAPAGSNSFTYDLGTATIDDYTSLNTQVGVTVAAVPEPSGLALVAGAVAIGGLGTVARRRRAA